jgi:hypothetical protein
MLYLLDANVLITAQNQYYPVDAVPEFWGWLVHMGNAGNIKMPIETLEEVKDGSNDTERDLLYAWIQDDANRAAILFDEDVQPALVQRVTDHYAPDLTDDELEAIGRDPFLIAHALADPAHRCVVTTEVSKRRLQRQNRRIPDVCADVGVQCCDTFAMLRALRFRTGWRG